MELREIANKTEWEDFLGPRSEKTFLQSWNWGEFNVSTGHKIWRLGVYEQGGLLAVVLVIKFSARRGTFLFVPHGPVFLENLAMKDKKEAFLLILTHLKASAIEESASFIRISPLFERNEENQNFFADMGFREAPMHSSAYEATWKLDIYSPIEELMANMRKTTRYLIKKAEKNPNIIIETSDNPKDIAIYQKLNREVAKSQKFVPFSDEFIKKEFEAFAKDRQILFFFAKYRYLGFFSKILKFITKKPAEEKIIAGAMVIFWPALRQGGSGIAFYHQAASLKKFAKISAPYLLQWNAIKEAKLKHCSVYDFWGFTDPQKYPKHPWAGPTLFKMGFGGYQKEYVKTQDFIISKKYWINYIIEKIRKMRREL